MWISVIREILQLAIQILPPQHSGTSPVCSASPIIIISCVQQEEIMKRQANDDLWMSNISCEIGDFFVIPHDGAIIEFLLHLPPFIFNLDNNFYEPYLLRSRPLFSLRTERLLMFRASFTTRRVMPFACFRFRLLKYLVAFGGECRIACSPTHQKLRAQCSE